MHVDEIVPDENLVRRLLTAQFPHWAVLPVAAVESSGTDNAILRLGDDMAIRLPRRAGVELQVTKEARWLPLLAPQLPLAIPVPLGAGVPGEGYPFHWSIVRWLAGQTVLRAGLRDAAEGARDLAGFIAALQRIDTTGGPVTGAHNFGRGGPLITRDAVARKAIAESADLIDAPTLLRIWDMALAAPIWDRPPVWIHADLHDENLLVTDGRLSGVIDFGGLALGDPACELAAAWAIFDRPGRDVFRKTLGADAASWARGVGWALSIAAIQIPYYRDTSPVMLERSLRVVAGVLADFG